MLLVLIGMFIPDHQVSVYRVIDPLVILNVSGNLGFLAIFLNSLATLPYS